MGPTEVWHRDGLSAGKPLKRAIRPMNRTEAGRPERNGRYARLSIAGGSAMSTWRRDELWERNERRFAPLLTTMSMINVPTARPSFVRHDEATGMALLSLSLRLSHIHRVTETLRLINTDHLSRTVSLDLDLRKLTARQRRSLGVHEVIGERADADARPQLWVPISRHSREDLAPVVVRNASDDVVPRL